MRKGLVLFVVMTVTAWILAASCASLQGHAHEDEARSTGDVLVCVAHARDTVPAFREMIGVVVLGTQAGGYTDKDGAVMLRGLPAGRQVLMTMAPFLEKRFDTVLVVPRKVRTVVVRATWRDHYAK